MTTIAIPMWDEEFLKSYEQGKHEDEVAELTDKDWAQAMVQLEHEIGSTLHRYRNCPIGKCRRARACRGIEALCYRVRQPTIVPIEYVEQMRRDIYAEMQTLRRARVLRAKAEPEEEQEEALIDEQDPDAELGQDDEE